VVKLKRGLIFILVVAALAAVGYWYFSSSKSQPQEQMVSETQEETGVVAGYKDISPAEAKKLIDENSELIVIDVSPNYAKGHLPEAVSYYVGDGSLEKAIPTLDKNATYLVYCHTDVASRQGAQMLIDAGFTDVYRLKGNYAAWVDAGYEVEK